jgi:hypothetical protein
MKRVGLCLNDTHRRLGTEIGGRVCHDSELLKHVTPGATAGRNHNFSQLECRERALLQRADSAMSEKVGAAASKIRSYPGRLA